MSRDQCDYDPPIVRGPGWVDYALGQGEYEEEEEEDEPETDYADPFYKECVRWLEQKRSNAENEQ
jgi:hypothetical protein